MAVQTVATIPADLIEARERLAKMARWIEASDDPIAVGDAARTLYEVREWARIRKVSSDIRAEAMRLEAVALRRIGQMGEAAIKESGIPNSFRSAARGFAEMSDREFAEVLERSSGETPVSAWRMWQRTVGAQRQGNLYGAGDYGDLPQRSCYDPDVTAKAARTIVSDAIANGMMYTHDEATEVLIDTLGMVRHDYADPDSWSDLFDNPHFRRGVSEVVRTAVNHAHREDGAPLVIPVETSDHGWIQVPWAVAKIEHLEQMSRRREQQARDLAAAAERLTALTDRMRRMARAVEAGRDDTLGEIERAFTEAKTCPICHVTRPCYCLES